MQTVHIGSDHAGFALKQILLEELSTLGYTTQDEGPASAQSCDYPVIAQKLCSAIQGKHALGILICGTGIGMSMAANRFQNIRAALCANEFQARMSRRHNDANVLCLGARVTGDELAKAIVLAFLESSFEGGRHQRRIDLFSS